MSELSIAAQLLGFDEANNGLKGLSEGMDRLAASSKKLNKTSTGAGSDGVKKLGNEAAAAGEEQVGSPVQHLNIEGTMHRAFRQ